MSEPRSLTRDSSALLRKHIEDAKRTRSTVKQKAKFNSFSGVVFVPAPVPCVCRVCLTLSHPLKSA